jgi:hypothetical protein
MATSALRRLAAEVSHAGRRDPRLFGAVERAAREPGAELSPSIPIIATNSDPAKIAAVALELFGHVEAARIAHAREAAARAIGDTELAEAWRRIAAEIKLSSQ